MEVSVHNHLAASQVGMAEYNQFMAKQGRQNAAWKQQVPTLSVPCVPSSVPGLWAGSTHTQGGGSLYPTQNYDWLVGGLIY